MSSECEMPPVLQPEGDALFLDFDGTLVDLAPRPDAIVVPAAVSALLVRLHDRLGGAVAIVTGRSLADLSRWLPGFPGAVAASHGAEMKGGAAAALPEGLAALHAAAEAAARQEGLLFERKTMGAALHFRESPARAAAAEAAARSLAAAFPAFALQPARMAWELKPRGATKDAALARLCAAPPFAGRRPAFAGDDATDEPALAWVGARGGIAVRVGGGASCARYRLPGPDAVLDWLRSEA